MVVVALKARLVRYIVVIAIAPCPVGSRVDVRAGRAYAESKRAARDAAAVGILAASELTDLGRDPNALPRFGSPDRGRGEQRSGGGHCVCPVSNGCHSRAAAGEAEHHFHVLRVVGMDGVDEASVAICCSIPLLVDLAHNLVDEIVAALIRPFYHVTQVLGLWSRHARQARAPYCGARAQFHLLHHPSRTELPRWRSYSDEARRASCVGQGDARKSGMFVLDPTLHVQ